MGAASYVGRVGGLAVALGVGTAIAMGNGVATAETTDSSPDTTKTTTDTTNAERSTTPKAGESLTDNAPTGEETEEAEEVDESDETEELEELEELEETEETEETEELEEPQPPRILEPEPPETIAEDDNNESPRDPAPPTTATQPGVSATSLATGSPADSASINQEVDDVAAFVDARTLAASGPLNLSPMMAAQTEEDLPETTTVNPDVLTAAVELVSGVLDSLLNPTGGESPIDPAAPTLAWSLLAFARKEVDDFFNALSGGTTEDMTLAAAQTMSLALVAPTPPPTTRPGFPAPGQYLSVSTQFVDWITGNNPANNTQHYYGVTGTDLGIMWDNGMVDDPLTPDVNEHQVLIAFGDTFGLGGMATGTHWRPNVLFRSVDADLFNGLDFTDPEWFTGSDFGGSPLTYVPPGAPYEYMARQIIFPEGLPAGITLIPTAGISVPTPGTEYDVTQYISFMSVTHWGAPGVWTTNYSALAYSEDNGETWKVAPQTVRYNNPATGNQNFQQMAFVRPGDGFVYAYGTPNGRNGAAHVARVLERDILDLSKYEYYSAGSAGGWYGVGATPAGWVKGNPAAATPIFGQSTTTAGACGAVNVNPGSAVSEMSVQYNQQLKKYVALHGDRSNNIVMRTSDRPEGGWSGPKVLLTQQNGGIYAPMMHPWSPSTQGTGSELYWNLSLWSDYNVMLMKTDLNKVG